MRCRFPILSLAMILTPLSLVSCAKQSDYREQSNNANNNAKSANHHLKLGEFQQINGTRYLLAEVKEDEPQRSSGSSHSQEDQIRNLVFLDGESVVSHRLFDTDSYVILAATQFPNKDKDIGQPSNPGIVTQWLVYQVLKADTNLDGRWDEADQKTIGVTDASGSGYTEVISGIDQIFGTTMVTPGKLVVVYAQSHSKNAAIIDLANRKVISTKPLTELGSEVR